jgi:hypothetical protein
MRQSILRELAVQSLSRGCDVDDLGPELIRAAAREGITLFEFIRERLLLKAGVASVSALVALPARLAEVNRQATRQRTMRRAA